MTEGYQSILDSILVRFGGATRWRVGQGDVWCTVAPAHHVLRRQGWKLHVAATRVSAPRVLERAGRVLVEQGCAFKFAATPRVAAELNAPGAERASSGKFITAYPSDDGRLRTLAAALHAATRGLEGPAILSDRRVEPGSLVHYRFGCFARPRELNDDGFYEGRLLAPDGSSVPDERHPWFWAPPWAGSPFPGAAPGGPGRRNGSPVLLADRYEVREAIRHSNRGGVYRARDRVTGEEILLKEARPHVGANADGTDVRDLLRHEARVLERLAPRGIVPRPRGVFESGGHVFLAEDLVEGISLQEWTADRLESGRGVTVEEAWRLAGDLARLVGEAHAGGLVLRDLKPGNVVMTARDRPVLVDLECAVRPGAPAPIAGTRGFTDPEHLDAAAATNGAAARPHPPAPGREADCHSLGATLLHAVSGISPALAADSPPSRPDAERIAAIVASAAADLPALRALAPLVLGLTAPSALRWSLARAREFLGAPPYGGRHSVPAGPDVAPPARLLADGLAFLADTITPGEEHLWPAPRSLPPGDPCNVQMGAGGVLAVLAQAVRHGHREVEPTLRIAARWLAERLAEPGRVLPGLYFGRSGSAWALHEAARTLGDKELAERAAEYALAIPLDTRRIDVCHGLAGAGTVLLHLGRATGDPRFSQRASQCADRLLALLRAGSGVHWPLTAPAREELSGSSHYGFGHGVAGNAAFLLAAGRRLERPELTEIALSGAHALCALTRWQDGVALWPKGPGATERTGLNYWCHGASGIGTFLVRAWRASGDAPLLRHAEGAAAAVDRDRWRLGPGACHGVAGNAELLLDLHAATGEERYLVRARESATCLAVRAVRRDGRLIVPDDTLRDVCAAYNVGLAGVLDFLLRLGHGGPRSWLVD